MRPALKFIALSLMALSCLLRTELSESQTRGPKDKASPPELKRSTGAGASSSYTTCYFRDSKGSISWEWGLKSDNGWYSMSGNWITTSLTKIQKFETTDSYESIYASCENSKKYYKVSGDLFAIFAATSGAGSNYPILVGGGELFSQY